MKGVPLRFSGIYSSSRNPKALLVRRLFRRSNEAALVALIPLAEAPLIKLRSPEEALVELVLVVYVRSIVELVCDPPRTPTSYVDFRRRNLRSGDGERPAISTRSCAAIRDKPMADPGRIVAFVVVDMVVGIEPFFNGLARPLPLPWFGLLVVVVPAGPLAVGGRGITSSTWILFCSCISCKRFSIRST